MPTTIANFLHEASVTIQEIEKKAKKALQEHGNEEEYKNLMRQKARYLASLAQEGKEVLHAEPNQALRKKIECTLEDFSNNATMALRLNSTFYMSALLYPDNYNEGEPNNLDVLAESVKS